MKSTIDSCLCILILLGLALQVHWLNKVLPLLVLPLTTLVIDLGASDHMTGT